MKKNMIDKISNPFLNNLKEIVTHYMLPKKSKGTRSKSDEPVSLAAVLPVSLVAKFYNPNQLPRNTREFHMAWTAMTVHKFLDCVYKTAQVYPNTASGNAAVMDM
jgi:hypothetical protein